MPKLELLAFENLNEEALVKVVIISLFSWEKLNSFYLSIFLGET